MISDFCSIPFGNVTNLFPNFFEKEKYVLDYEILQVYMRLGLKLEKVHHLLEFNQSQQLKPHVEFNTQRRIGAKKNGDKD